jgi:hypothetical protein
MLPSVTIPLPSGTGTFGTDWATVVVKPAAAAQPGTGVASGSEPAVRQGKPSPKGDSPNTRPLVAAPVNVSLRRPAGDGYSVLTTTSVISWMSTAAPVAAVHPKVMFGGVASPWKTPAVS